MWECKQYYKVWCLYQTSHNSKAMLPNYLAGHFAESYFVTVSLFKIISVADHLTPCCYFVELFSRLIVTLVQKKLLSHG